MEQLRENIVMISAGEPIPDEIISAGDWIKIYLAGSIDLNEDGKFDWQGIFCKGLAALTDPNKGLIMMKNQKYLIINPRYVPGNPEPVLQNEEFMTKVTWSADMMDQADAVILNFLSKSVSPIPMLEFGMLLRSEKLVVRCPEKYVNYSTVKILCEKYNVPLYPSAVSATRDLVQGMYAYIPRLKEIQSNKLPE